MAVTIYHEQDCDPSIIQGKKVAIIGYGSQGHAHALNLMDSGCDVRVGLREGSSSADKAREAGLKVTDMATAAKEGNVIMILTPDETQPAVYKEFVEPGSAFPGFDAFASNWGRVRFRANLNTSPICASPICGTAAPDTKKGGPRDADLPLSSYMS